MPKISKKGDIPVVSKKELVEATKPHKPLYVQASVRQWCKEFKQMLGFEGDLEEVSEQNLTALAVRLSEHDRNLLIALGVEILQSAGHDIRRK